MIDMQSLGLVLGGTLVATIVQAGFRNVGSCLSEIGSIFGPKFDAGKIKSQLAKQINSLKKDGLVRATTAGISDMEFERATAAMIEERSLDAMLKKYQSQRNRRSARARSAQQCCHQAAELAQVFGLAGTLLSLGMLDDLSGASGVAAAIGMAVATTLYGVMFANLLFLPLAGIIERRAISEDRAREELFLWLEGHALGTAPSLSREERDLRSERPVQSTAKEPAQLQAKTRRRTITKRDAA